MLRLNRADVEVQTRDLEGGVKLTFMKFTFASPALEIKAPVLNDKTVGFQVYRKLAEVPVDIFFNVEFF